jgi:hypothetical protein
MLLEATRPLKIGTASTRLELIYLTLDPPESAARTPAPARPSQPPGRHGAPISPLIRRQSLSEPGAAAPGEEDGEEDNAIHPPIDWAKELNRTVRESASGELAPEPREFGSPHVAPKSPAKPPEFGWSHSRTHRLERGPGSVGIHLGDHCVIALSPLPSVVCSPGQRDANGDLFKHMRDPQQPGDWKDPP